MVNRSKICMLCLGLIAAHVSAQAKSGWTLNACIDSAIANNLALRQSVNNIELSRINVKQSKNNLLPAFNGSVAQDLSVGKMVNPVTGVYETGTVWSGNIGLNFSQNLFDGLQLLNTIKQNELIYKSSKLDWEDARFNLTINVVNDFLQVLYTDEAVKIARNQVSADSVNLQTTSDMEYVGKKTESDVLQIKSQLATDKYAVINATSQWKMSKVNLQQLMNFAVAETFDIDYNTAIAPQVAGLEDISSVYVQSLAFQPIIKSYALKTQGALYAVKTAKGAYYPQLMLKGNFGTDYSSAAMQSTTTTTSSLQNIGYVQGNPSDIVVGNVPQQFTSLTKYAFGNQLRDNFDGTFSVALTVPILNYLQVRNNVKKQQVNLNSAALNEELTKVNLRKTIEQVYTNEENSQAQFKSAMEEVEANKAAYDLSVEKYKQGKMIASDLIVQQNAYVKSLSDYLQAKYGLFFNSKILDYYKGVAITF